MKLLNEKFDDKHFVVIGYDTYSKSYIAHQTDCANDWYYKISEELYLLFDTDKTKYSEQIERIINLREKSSHFYFSYLHNGNNNSPLNDLYYWRDLCIGKTPEHIHKHIGNPNDVNISEEFLEELYLVDRCKIKIFYKDNICTDIIV